MTRYIDWADVTNRYPSVARDRASENTSLGVLVEDAEGEVDSRLAPRYATPFVPGSSNVPQIVRTLAADLVYYKLNMQQKWASTLRDYIDARFKALLEGDAALVNSSGVIAPTQSSRAWTSTPYRTSFGVDDPIEYSVSQTWQEAAQDDRSGD